ncbi:MAG: hypothetical protein ACI35S_05420 [Anaeroplasma sp.]
MYLKTCRNCKWLKNGICIHPDMVSQEDIKEAIIEHIEVAFDGNIQSNLNKVIKQYCNLDEKSKEDLIAAICTICSNYLTDPSNMFLEDDGFMPPFDFFCMNWD